ncbi:MAG: cobalamin B12-binding domain-containing protein [Chloroflexi bacterium]|nr:cobalamin B12-binding domain-containing protein [Chloroflexota bacterium]
MNVSKEEVLAGSLGDCLHVAGTLNFLRMAEEQGCHAECTGPATSVEAIVAAAQEVDPQIVAVSYRLTPQNAALLLAGLRNACQEAGLLEGRRFVFGGPPPAAQVARQTGMSETPPHLSNKMGLAKVELMGPWPTSGFASTAPPAPAS